MNKLCVGVSAKNPTSPSTHHIQRNRLTEERQTPRDMDVREVQQIHIDPSTKVSLENWFFDDIGHIHDNL